MARVVKSPTLVPSTSVMTAVVHLNDLSSLAIETALAEAFPFPRGSLLTGHKLMSSREGGHEVLLFACAKMNFTGALESGLAALNDQELLWFVHPAPKRLSRRQIAVSLAAGFLFVFCLAALNVKAQRRLDVLRSQYRRTQERTLVTYTAENVAQFLPRVIEKIPGPVEVTDMDIDFSKRVFVFRGRAPHYGGVSDTVSSLGRVEGLSGSRAAKSQLTKEGTRTFVDFTFNANLL